MTMATLADGTRVHCLIQSEAIVLDEHVEGYFKHGIELKPGDTVFDVGANIGVFALRALQKHAEIKVFAFEPIPPIFAILEQNKALHGDGRLIALPYGASREKGGFSFQYYPNSPALSTAHPEFWDQNPDMLAKAVEGSIEQAPKSLWYARLVPRFLSGWLARHLRSGAETLECEVRTVSSVIREYDIERIDLLKVDCEGAELDVLLGIEETHWPRIQKAIIEVHDVDGRLEDIRRIFESRGFSQLSVEKEVGFEETAMHNLYATR